MHVEMAVHTVRSSSSGLNSTHESVRTGQQEDGVRHIVNGPVRQRRTGAGGGLKSSRPVLGFA